VYLWPPTVSVTVYVPVASYTREMICCEPCGDPSPKSQSYETILFSGSVLNDASKPTGWPTKPFKALETKRAVGKLATGKI